MFSNILKQTSSSLVSKLSVKEKDLFIKTDFSLYDLFTFSHIWFPPKFDLNVNMCPLGIYRNKQAIRVLN